MTATSFSHMQRITELLGRRDLTIIPRDQQALLDRPDSWAVDLADEPHGLAQVPGHVLQTVTETYLANKRPQSRERQLERTDEVEPSSPVASSQVESPRSVGHHVEVPNTKSSSPDPPPHSSPAHSPVHRLLSWSPSPSRTQVQHQPRFQSSIVRETPKVVSASSPSKLSRPVPPPQAAPVLSFPSTENEDDDLEMELPNHVKSTREQSSWASTSTPPCAQPHQSTIPSTQVNPKSSPMRTAPQAASRPFRRHRPHMLDGIQNPSRTVNPIVAKAAPRKGVIGIESSDTTSPSTSTGPSIPATKSELHLERPPVIQRQVATIPQDSIVADLSRGDHEDADEAQESPIIDPSFTSGLQSRPRVEPTVSLENSEPFLAFCAAYPEFTTKHKGDLWNFIRACVCLDYLRTGKDLRECLYDDFIRAFSDGFLDYVQHSQDQDPLPAVNWYNDLDGPAVFNRLLVTKKNLPRILQLYPTEVARLKKIVKSDDQVDAALSPEQEAGSTARTEFARTPQSERKSGEARRSSVKSREKDDREVVQITDPAVTDEREAHRSPSDYAPTSPLLRDVRTSDKVSRRRSSISRSDEANATHISVGASPTSNATQPRAVLTQIPAPPSPELGFESPTILSQVSTPIALSRAPALSKSPDAHLPRQRTSLKRPSDREELVREHLLRKKSGASSTPSATAQAPPRSSPYFRRPSDHRASSVRTSEERERLREHFRKRRSSGAASVASAGTGSR